MASSCERASEAGVFARALNEVPASLPLLQVQGCLPPSLPSVLLSLEEGKWQWPVKYVNFSSFPPPVALNQDVAATAAHEFARMSPTVWVGLHQSSKPLEVTCSTFFCSSQHLT